MSAETARTEAYRREDRVDRSELTDPVRTPEDDRSPDEEASLRPRTLDEFIGQPELREHITITLHAAVARAQPPDHLLFAGPPGLGKTTLAGIIAAELGAVLHITSGPAIERAGDLAAMLTNLADGDVLFIDEIHRLPKVVEEVLYPAMEDFAIDIVLGKGPAARSIRFDLPRFTLVGATTRTGLISGPLRDRFGLVERLDYYSADDLAAIVRRAASILGVRIDSEGGAEIATRSRGTPRIANRLLRRVRDYAEVRADGAVDAAVAKAGLAVFGVDDLGLDKVDRAILDALAITHAGRPLGLSTLSITVGEQAETVEDVYEPFLIQQGLVQRTPRGRIATAAAYAHLGVAVPLSLEALAEPRDERIEATLFEQASPQPESQAASGGEPESGSPDEPAQASGAKSESAPERPQTDETPW
ncbi:Holliday junction branch migration DNA helicase RuvB [Candidatus Poriferisodalis sp.]|uniref:Holliday junction branch migration DNA helicase RuvB n=1 Tax=Candidatus Poriferisodalis sp. TaxID=3101277 RepID=UPI003D12005E